MKTNLLERFAYCPDGTFGLMTLPSGLVLYTAERPWLGNKQGVSCIPEGVYKLGKRNSPVVAKSSGGAYDEGWEVLDVPGRTFIMIHPGNFPMTDVRGCIAVGKAYRIIEDRLGIPRNAVSSSRPAFRELMNVLDTSDYWDIEIIPKLISYP